MFIFKFLLFDNNQYLQCSVKTKRFVSLLYLKNTVYFSEIISIGKNAEKLEPSSTASDNVKWYNNCRIFLAVSQKTKQRFTIWPSNSAPRYIPQVTENRDSNRYLYANVTAALFVIAKRRKKHKCPSINNWINKMKYIHTMEYYSAIERNGVLIHATDMDEP